MPTHPNFPFPLYLVISERDCLDKPWLWVAEQAILGGVDIIQLREKESPYAEFLAKAHALKQLCDQYRVPLVINDQVAIALEIGAWGVHVGQSDMSPSAVRKIGGDKLNIGWSLEDDAQLQSAEFDYVDQLGVSPIFATATKTDTITEWGIAGLRDLRRQTDKPLIAIGQMNFQTAGRAWHAGANSVAVVSAICQAVDPQEASKQLKEQLQ